MITWGISANSHDAALAVFADEKLVFASHSERFSGIKNDPNLCTELVAYAKDKWGEPNRVVWYENPYVKTIRQLFAGQGWKWGKNNVKKYLASYNINAPISYCSHHLAHAAGGYYTSKFDNACVVVIDAIGEFETLTIWHADGVKLSKLYSLSYPHSIGLFYSAMTQRCHLKPQEEEYILMGMAAYGTPGKLTRDMLNDFVQFPNNDYGNPVQFRQNLHKGCQTWRPDLIINDTFDIAAATQEVYEMMLNRVLQHATTLTSSRNLVLTGGCALNCLANRIAGQYFTNIWVPVDPGDAGSAIGAVLAKRKWRLDPDYYNAYQGRDLGYTTDNADIVDYLEEHQICGVARGKAEFGPRALGNRSILADPRGDTIKDRVNDIKQREQYRPFAPAILEEHVDEYFRMPYGWDNSRHMAVVARCRRPDLFPAIVHRDGTSRIQTVPNDGSQFRKLLELWYARTGCPMLLNTSLNIKGQPIVNDRAAASLFERHHKIRVFN
jgi:carbamoyltransferase